MTSLWTPGGVVHTAPPRAALPTEDIRLADGRRLRYHGVQSLTEPGAIPVQAGTWMGPDNLRVLASLDDTGRWGALLHVSLSYPHRDPPWATIKAVRAAFFGDVDVMMVLPRAADYVNVHAHAFHLWQTPEAWGIR